MTAGTGDPVRAVHVIVTCTNRKTRPVPGRLRLASIRGGGPARRARAWITRLSHDSSPIFPAYDLYAGEHWQVACALPRSGRRNEQVRLWVCSAGYGLIPADAPIRPYAATFTAGSPDSVPGSAAGRTAWWQALGDWEGPCPGQPRSISALVAREPAAVYFLVLSDSYLRACHTDIAAACGLAADLDRVIGLSAGARNPGELSGIMVPADARLQACLGGTRQALNARIARRLLSHGIRSRAQATGNLAQLLAVQPAITRYERKKLTDQEVVALIAESLARSPGSSASRLLREFRDAGFACEQQRFAHLYRTYAKAPSR